MNENCEIISSKIAVFIKFYKIDLGFKKDLELFLYLKLEIRNENINF